jgi:transposase InsO family protein
MEVNPSGYYKWRSRRGRRNQYVLDRELLSALLKDAHRKHKSFGYHRLATVVRRETGWLFSDNLAHKCCKWYGIRSKARHYKRGRAGEEHVRYPNLVGQNWAVAKPMELVVSDMTQIQYRGRRYEWTYILDVYNNEILSHHCSARPGDRVPYLSCLRDLMGRARDRVEPVMLHTDQGSVYASRAFAKVHEQSGLLRSMSRAGKPTDNPVIESINGWIKAELKVDFPPLGDEGFKEYLDRFVRYFNEDRPSYKLKYQSPVQYRTAQGFG